MVQQLNGEGRLTPETVENDRQLPRWSLVRQKSVQWLPDEANFSGPSSVMAKKHAKYGGKQTFLGHAARHFNGYKDVFSCF
jgi:hypothetical protein